MMRPNGPDDLLAPFVPTKDDPFDLPKAGHLLRRAAFGGSIHDRHRLVRDGVERAVARMFEAGPGEDVDAAFPDRHTLVFRFFGDDATFRPLPDHSDAGYGPGGVLFIEEMAALKPGDPFRSPTFRQLV